MPKPRIYLSSPHMGTEELTLVQEAFATNWIAPLGPHVDAFEREFADYIGGRRTEGGGRRTEDGGRRAEDGRRRAEDRGQLPDVGRQSARIKAAALSSGTAALHLALRLLELRPGEEVFCSTFTFSASANPIVYEGAKPVFIDSETQSWNMDPARLAEALADREKKGRLPRAVILVHLYGQSADIDPIAELCAHHGVTLIEDAAEALGATYVGGQRTEDRGQRTEDGGRRTEGGTGTEAGAGTTTRHPSLATRHSISPGTVGRMGVYSFNGNKIITTSGGGMLVSAEAALIEKAKFLASQARDPAPHYEHSEIGYNYRLSNVLAAIGRGQLRVLADRVNARRANCEFYQRAFADLPGLEFMPEAPWGRSTRWLTCVLIDPEKFGADREAVRLALLAENIEARPVWKPMHLQPVFAGCERFGGGVAEDLFARGLCLPSGSNLAESDLMRVVEAARSVMRR